VVTPNGQVAPGGAAGSRLKIDPSSIGAAKKAFSDALDGVQAQLRQIRSAHQQAWAGDPVSAETAQAINNRTAGGAEEFSAENVLSAYAGQLAAVVDNLTRAEQTYRRNESDNAALMGKHLKA
jgi:hypothetical protein